MESSRILKPPSEHIRLATFGMGTMGQVVCVRTPKKKSELGDYVHVEDVEKFLNWKKENGLQIEGSGKCGKT